MRYSKRKREHFENKKCLRNAKRSNEIVEERRGFEGFIEYEEAQATTSPSR